MEKDTYRKHTKDKRFNLLDPNDPCFDPKLFNEDYYEHQERGGFVDYTWEKVKGQAVGKINFIQSYFPKVKSILFGACAKGFEVRVAREKNIEAFGFDVSEYALEHMDKSAKDFCCKGELTKIPYESDSFNIVAVFDAIHIVHPKTRDKAYEEINRVAQNGVVLRTAMHADRLLGDIYWDGSWDGLKVCRETIPHVKDSLEAFGKFKLHSVLLSYWSCFEKSNVIKVWFVFKQLVKEKKE